MDEIYIKAPGQSLDEFVRLLSDACGIDGWEQRFSLNWPNGTYYISQAFGIEIRAMAADSTEFLDYDFWVIAWSRPRTRWTANFLLALITDIARNLVAYVSEVARPISSEMSANDAAIYRKSETGSYTVTQRMKRLSALPHWRFEISEVSMGVYEVVGRRSSGEMFSKKGFEQGALIDECKNEAQGIGP
jgi:hypothetical protein